MKFIILFLPAVFAVDIQLRRNKEQITRENWGHILIRYAKWVVMLNIITAFSLRFLFSMEGMTEESLERMTVGFGYAAFSVIGALVLPYVVEVVRKYFSAELVIDKKENQNDI